MTIQLNKPSYTTSEAAKALGVSRKAILRITADGLLRRMPGFDKPWRFSRDAIAEYMGQGGAE